MDAVSRTPGPVNEPVRQYQPGSHERAVLESKIKELAGQRAELTMTIGGRQQMPDGEKIERGPAAQQDARARPARQRDGRGRGQRDLRGQAGGARLAGAQLRGPGRDLPQGGGTARRSVARHRERRHHPRPVQVAVPGGDRRGLRADRLLALQRLLRQENPERAAGIGARHVEPDGVPPARGLRAGDHPVQLHLDRGQPADRARPARQRGGVEAVPDPAALGALPDAPAGGGGPAARGDQPGHRGRAGGVPGRADPPRPGRHPLHRLHRDLPAPVADRRGEHRPVPELPAAGGRDGRQGLRDRASVGGPAQPGGHADPRRVRVPGPEVLRGLPRVRARIRLGPDQRRFHRPGRVADHGRRGVRPVAVPGRGHRRPRVRQARRRAGAGQEHGVDHRPGRRPGRRHRGILRAAHGARGLRPGRRDLHHRVLRPHPGRARLPGRDGLRGDARPGRGRHALRADRRDPGHGPRRDQPRPRRRSGTRRATSTSTTSRPARWSASSRSAAPAPAARTTRPARSST